jgi:leucyl aminopeptidase
MRAPVSLHAKAEKDSGEDSDRLNLAQTRFAPQIHEQHARGNFGVERRYNLRLDAAKPAGEHLKGDAGERSCERLSESVVVPLEDGALNAEVVQALDAELGGQLSALKVSGDLPTAPGSYSQMPLPAGSPWSRIVLVNTPIADNSKGTASDENRLAQHLANALRQVGKTNVQRSQVLLSALASRPVITPSLLQGIVKNTEDHFYQFDQYKTEQQPVSALKEINFTVSAEQAGHSETVDQVTAAIRQGKAVAKGMSHAKDLANMPANDCTPTFLAQEAVSMASDDDRFTTEVLDEAQMKALGMNTLLSVSNGSAQPAKLIIMKYQGADVAEKPVALVGKGITFDSGGISIKPSGGMEDMKFDMGGAASVFGVMTALKEHRPNINVIGVVAAAENMPSGTATRPGDVVETLSGKTVEIINTDAEGRLVLSDALTYTQAQYDPKEVIDVATLTGAIVVALGDQASGVFSNDDKLAQSLVSAGERTGDRAWQLPVWPEYQSQLKSHTADMKNVGGRAAGSITAASFLSAFVDRPWAHLDVAATASKPSGATGRPVPLLYQHLMDHVSGESLTS